MEFLVQDGAIHIVSDKKHTLLDGETVTLDEMKIDTAGEYEKSGILLYVNTWDEQWMYYFRIEGYWVGYIPNFLTEMENEKLKFFGQLDILLMPTSKKSQKLIEQIDPKMLITYGDEASEVPALFGENYEPLQKYKLKASDISLEKTSCLVLDL